MESADRDLVRTFSLSSGSREFRIQIFLGCLSDLVSFFVIIFLFCLPLHHFFPILVLVVALFLCSLSLINFSGSDNPAAVSVTDCILYSARMHMAGIDGQVHFLTHCFRFWCYSESKITLRHSDARKALAKSYCLRKILSLLCR